MNEFAPKPAVPAELVMTEGTEIRPAAQPRHHIGPRQAILGTLFLLALVAAGVYADHYWKVGRFLETTDDAYVKADFTIVAPKVSGYISQVLVEDNQAVEAGQVLARIEDSDFQTALTQAKADVASAEADVRNIEAQLAEQASVIKQAEAAIAADQAAVSFTAADYKRYHDLTARQVTSVQDEQRARTALQQAQAELQRDRAALTAAQQRIDVLNTAKAKAETEIVRLQAVQKQAELNLGYTNVIAPIDGTVGARSLRVGQYVQAGTQLMAVVPLHAVYVIANFKETQLGRMRPGQPVSIEVDSYPGVEISGHVDSLSPASGLEFSLLPPDNATGNFTKIVQRVPVKILIDASELSGNLLKAGMSVEPTVNTKADARS